MRKPHRPYFRLPGTSAAIDKTADSNIICMQYIWHAKTRAELTISQHPIKIQKNVDNDSIMLLLLLMMMELCRLFK